MSLTDLWNQDRTQLLNKRVQQIIAFAGNGQLGDDSVTSREFRDFLRHVPSDQLATYAAECLEKSFQDSGLVLQDLINQAGRRLGFDVTDGRYRGKPGHSGHDGIWRLPDGHAILVEVKTTDAYRIDLNVLAGYRKTLGEAELIDFEHASMLIVVGREDTGDLEAQIRGSRHAWDIRLISVDALLRLLFLKESVEDPQTIQRIHAILIPREFTRLDELVEVIFTAAEDVHPDEPEVPQQLDAPSSTEAATPKFVPVNFHDACAARLEGHLSTTLVKTAKAFFSSPDNKLRLSCSVSKRHDFAGDEAYWFAYHPYYTTFLQQAERQYVTFGCGAAEQLFVFPLSVFAPWLEGSYVTRRDEKFYWHVQLFREGAKWYLKRRQQAGNVEVTKYLLPATSASRDTRRLEG